MSNAAAPEDVEKLSFEDALDELERITACLLYTSDAADE